VYTAPKPRRVSCYGNLTSHIHELISNVGTGKTLIARALANECSQGDRKVSFFMRKGADCLSKWVGESERQLRLLFEQVQYWFGILQDW
jgi:SpoVK/Ycf46/Vps4 family AAA+-type ATPase